MAFFLGRMLEASYAQSLVWVHRKSVMTSFIANDFKEKQHNFFSNLLETFRRMNTPSSRCSNSCSNNVKEPHICIKMHERFLTQHC